MIRDHKPYWLKMLLKRYDRWWTEHYLRPHFTYLGGRYDIVKPNCVNVHGPNISLGEYAHLMALKTHSINISTWTHGEHIGHIEIGKYSLISPDVRICSASKITIGDSVMIANGVYISDADWHDLYDRNKVIGITREVEIKDNVWLGDSVTVNKGVTIGENSIIGASSNVTKDIPANVIAAGNPCKVIRPLDPDKELVTRKELFKDYDQLQQAIDYFDHCNLDDNTFLGWLRFIFFPRPGD